jgi:catechol 2,3-dioxygenase-like lactoylglutathione lyase family enzyme
VSAPRIERILETALYVDDLGRATRFYHEVLGLEPLLEDAKLCVFDAGRQTILLLFLRGGSTSESVLPGGRIPPHDGGGPLHMAFAVASEDLPGWEERLARYAVAIEARMKWPRGGASLYFRDPDGHLLELATPGIWATY